MSALFHLARPQRELHVRTSVVLDEDMQGVGVVQPANQSRVRCQRDDGVRLDHKMALERLGIFAEQSIHKPEELHDTLVLSQILVTFKKESVVLAVTTCDFQLPRSLLGRQHVERLCKLDDPDDGLSDVIRAWIRAKVG